MELGTWFSVIAVPSVVPLMGNSFTCGAVSVPVLHGVGAGEVSEHVTYAFAVVPGVPVTVPLTRLLVRFAFVPILQLFGRHEAEIPTVPAATPATFAPVLVPLTVAIAG